jgi:hypothetical protein
MNLRDWMSVAIGTDSWSRMEHTLPGALSKVVDQILYNFSEDGTKPYRGLVLSLSNAEKMYVGLNDKQWPKWDGRDVNNVDVRKTLRQIQHLLEAYAFAEVQGRAGTKHVCKHCSGAAP